jgi:hypothetical protein
MLFMCGATLGQAFEAEMRHAQSVFSHYNHVQLYVTEFHENLLPVLAKEVKVDTRVRGQERGLCQEPLALVLGFLGLSVAQDQLTQLDASFSRITKTCLLPGCAYNARFWAAHMDRAREGLLGDDDEHMTFQEVT